LVFRFGLQATGKTSFSKWNSQNKSNAKVKAKAKNNAKVKAKAKKKMGRI
jgi:hypothetical protein